MIDWMFLQEPFFGVVNVCCFWFGAIEFGQSCWERCSWRSARWAPCRSWWSARQSQPSKTVEDVRAHGLLNCLHSTEHPCSHSQSCSGHLGGTISQLILHGCPLFSIILRCSLHVSSCWDHHLFQALHQRLRLFKLAHGLLLVSSQRRGCAVIAWLCAAFSWSFTSFR